MSTITLSPKDYPTFILSTTKARREVFKFAAVSTAMWAWAKCVVKATEVGAVDRGRFRASYRVSKADMGTILARLSNSAPYAGYVEQGMPAGVVPSPDERIVWGIQKWTERKLVPLISGEVSKDDIFAIGRAVQQKLHDKGYKGRPILTDPVMRAQIVTKTRMKILEGMALRNLKGPMALRSAGIDLS